MPHKGNGAMFIQDFICQGDEHTHSQSKVLRSRAIGEREIHENLKYLQVRLKVPNRHLVQRLFLQRFLRGELRLQALLQSNSAQIHW